MGNNRTIQCSLMCYYSSIEFDRPQKVTLASSEERLWICVVFIAADPINGSTAPVNAHIKSDTYTNNGRATLRTMISGWMWAQKWFAAHDFRFQIKLRNFINIATSNEANTRRRNVMDPAWAQAPNTTKDMGNQWNVKSSRPSRVCVCVCARCALRVN